MEMNPDLIKLFGGFILTTVAGGFLGSWFQARHWKKQTQLDLTRRVYEQGVDFLDQFSLLVGTRFFALQRFLWTLDGPDLEKLKEIETEYFRAVTQWNAAKWSNRNKIRLLVGDASANEFLDYSDDHRPDRPGSLHYMFVKAHRDVQRAKRREITAGAAQEAVDDLDHMCSRLLERLTTEFTARAVSLRLLVPADTPAPAAQSPMRRKLRVPEPAETQAHTRNR